VINAHGSLTYNIYAGIYISTVVCLLIFSLLYEVSCNLADNMTWYIVLGANSYVSRADVFAVLGSCMVLVGNQLSAYTTQHPRRVKTSAGLQW
jgi:hypothetical protein